MLKEPDIVEKAMEDGGYLEKLRHVTGKLASSKATIDPSCESNQKS